MIKNYWKRRFYSDETPYFGDRNLNDEVRSRLAELQKKGIDVNEIITAALNKREEEIAEEKAHAINLKVREKRLNYTA